MPIVSGSTAYGTIPYAIFQTAAALPASDAGWSQVVGGIVLRDQEGCGQFVGMAEFEWHAGTTLLPASSNPPNFAVRSLQDLVGKYVRILVYDVTTPGPITVNGVTYSATWYGIIKRQTTIPDGATANPGGTQKFHAVGLPSLLDNIYIRQGYAYGYLAGVGTGPWDPGYCPLFNDRPTSNTNKFGNRYVSSQPNADGSASAYPFDLSITDPATTAWQAIDVIQHLLAFYAKPVVPTAFGTMYGPSWTVSDPLGCLNYEVDKLDFQGRTLLEAICYLINPRRGCTFYTTVSGTTITLNVLSASASAVTEGSFTLPASTTTYSLDTRGNAFNVSFELDQDISAKYEYIQVDGNHPLVAMSLNYKQDGSGAFIKGWDTATETAPGIDGMGEWDPSIEQGPAYENTWRRFVLKDSWSGVNWNQTTIGLRNKRTSASSGYDGTRSFDNTQAAGPARILKLEKFLPLPANVGWSTTPAANTLDMTSPLLAPLVFIKSGSDYYNFTGLFDVAVEEDPAAIVIGGPIAEILQPFLTDGTSELIVTIGVREANPLMVASLSGAAGTWDLDFPKCLVRRLPYCEQWVALKGTVMGANSTGTAFYTLSSTLTLIDDTPKLQGWLANLIAWYGTASNTVTWHNAIIDFTTGTGNPQPGALLTTAHRGDSNVTCNALITTRARNYSENGFGTTYTTERIIPDVACVESHPRVNQVWKAVAEI